MANVGISLFSLNARGMRAKNKRKSLFRLFKEKKYDIVCLQESYFLDKDSEIWEKEWGVN